MVTWDVDAEVVVGLRVIARLNQLGMKIVAHELAISIRLGVVNPSTAHLIIEALVLDSVGSATNTVPALHDEN